METSAKYYAVPFNTSNFSYKDNKYRIEYYRGRQCFEKIKIFDIYESFNFIKYLSIFIIEKNDNFSDKIKN